MIPDKFALHFAEGASGSLGNVSCFTNERRSAGLQSSSFGVSAARDTLHLLTKRPIKVSTIDENPIYEVSS